MHRFLALLLALGLASGAAHAQERDWALDASDQEAYLIFGVPDTDDVGVSLWCRTRKDMVNLYVPRPTAELERLDRRKVALTVKAGEETATFAGKVDLNRGYPSSSVEVEMPVDNAFLKALEKADRFSVKVGEQEMVFPLYNADVTTLLGLCRKG